MPAQFLESPRFPDDISYGSGGGPTFFNNVVVTPSGQRKVNIRRSQPLGSYNIAMGVRDQAQLNSLHAFFMVCYGGAVGFRFKDWGDYRVLAGQGVLLDAAGGKKQLAKRYQLAEGVFFDRIIQKPVVGTVEFQGGVGTLDFTTGLVAGCTATAWTGEFDVPVAFQGDSFAATIETFQTYNANLALDIIKV